MRRAAALLLLLGFACGKAAGPGEAGPQSSATAIADAGLPALATASLKRKTTPEERRLRDEKECEANNAASCRRSADRYRGYGHIAGCGVERIGPKPRRMVTAADARSDADLYDKWIRRACDLGDDDACIQGRDNVVSHRISERTVDACARSGVGDCALYQWASGMRPDKVKTLETERKRFMTHGFSVLLFTELYRKEKTRGGDALPKEVAELAERICKTSGECDDVFMMLDKNGYKPEALAGLRKTAGEALANACLEGDCVCGEAAEYLDRADARVLDLARMGCDAGEPDACFVLGDLYEKGAGVEKDEKAAFNLYSLACPSVLAADEREDIYSKAACDRLAAKYEEGGLVEKDIDRSSYYAFLACTRPGFEHDHAPCLRRGRFQATGQAREGFQLRSSADLAREDFFGISSDPVNGKECERPSVEAQCKRESGVIH